MKQTFLLTIFLNVFLISCIDRPKAETPQEPVYLVTAKEPTDEITIQNSDHLTIIDIQSFTGIGSAKVELESGDLPEAITIRLHLAGLEEFRISSEQTIIVGSFSSGSVLNSNNQKIIRSGKEQSINPIHPLWLEVKVISNDANPNPPLKEGYFEVTLPKEFIDESGNSFEIHWIDFYR